MSKSATLALVRDLSNGQADLDTSALLYDECLIEQSRFPVFTYARVLPVTANQPLITYPADVLRVFAVLYDATPLTHADLRQLEARNPLWRDQPGHPLAYVTEQETARTLRLYPKPMQPSGPQSFVFGEPLGRDFPVGSVTLICTTTAELPDWFDLPLALKILGKEFARESGHRDLPFAQACQGVYELCAALAIGEP